MEWLETWRISSLKLEDEYSAFHIHEYCEILYIISGAIRINTQDKSYVLRSGQMMILAPMAQHSVEILETPYERIGMHIDCDLLEQKGIGPVLMSVLKYRPDDSLYIFDLDGKATLSDTITQINAEAKSKLPKCEEMADVLFHHLLLQLYRFCPECFKTSAGDELMDSAKKYIEANLDNLPPINKIAGMYYLTPSHFIARFKAHTGHTPKKYYNLCRMTRARCLLCETELPLCDIAEKCGFSDLNGFVRSFRSSMGITPGKFRTICDNDSM